MTKWRTGPDGYRYLALAISPCVVCKRATASLADDPPAAVLCNDCEHTDSIGLMTPNSLPPEVAETQPGKCNLCGAEKPLAQLIDHLIDEHGKDPSDLKIEGGKVSEATVTEAGEADCGHELVVGDTVIVLDPFDGEQKTECMACHRGGDTTLGSAGR